MKSFWISWRWLSDNSFVCRISYRSTWDRAWLSRIRKLLLYIICWVSWWWRSHCAWHWTGRGHITGVSRRWRVTGLASLVVWRRRAVIPWVSLLLWHAWSIHAWARGLLTSSTPAAHLKQTHRKATCKKRRRSNQKCSVQCAVYSVQAVFYVFLW